MSIPDHNELASRDCKPRKGDADRMDSSSVEKWLASIPDWSLTSDGKGLVREFRFKGFYKTMGFVNAVAWIANQQVHHPDMEVGYNRCQVTFSTHDVDGLSENDFICAARVDALRPG